MLEGELCVDPNDACCCDEELLFDENGPSCIINYLGDATGLTFELVTQGGSTVLPPLTSAAECTSSGGWWAMPSTDFVRIELCDETCSIRRSETTRLRVLRGCPATSC